MPRNIGRFVVGLGALSFLAGAAYGHPPGRDAAVAQALAEVDAWLAKAPSADGWRRYLRLADLATQVPLGAKADANQVAEILARLESGAAGLDRPQLTKLRTAVAQWRRELHAPKLDQLSALAQQAKGQYRAVDAAVLKTDRAAVGCAAAPR